MLVVLFLVLFNAVKIMPIMLFWKLVMWMGANDDAPVRYCFQCLSCHWWQSMLVVFVFNVVDVINVEDKTHRVDFTVLQASGGEENVNSVVVMLLLSVVVNI